MTVSVLSRLSWLGKSDGCWNLAAVFGQWSWEQGSCRPVPLLSGLLVVERVLGLDESLQSRLASDTAFLGQLAGCLD